MARYIVQHRRGSAAQWAAHDTIIPKEGELVIEIDEENSLHKLKIGDGIHTYAELAYLMAGDEIVSQVLAEAKPRVVTVTLTTDWVQDADDKYSQIIAFDDITSHSRLDLQPDADMLAEFKQLGLVFVTENIGGVITIYSVGNMPLKSYTMQATIVETEVVVDSDKITGIPVGTPTAQSDWNQTDETKADYIKNKPDILTEEDVLSLIGGTGDNGGNVDLSEVNARIDEVETELESKADQSDIYNLEMALYEKMDKVMGEETQYAGFNGISPQAIAISPDTTPTENSTKLITSGGVYLAIGEIETALDGIIAIQNELIGGDVE